MAYGKKGLPGAKVFWCEWDDKEKSAPQTVERFFDPAA
jgi:hypothetical protein